VIHCIRKDDDISLCGRNTDDMEENEYREYADFLTVQHRCPDCLSALHGRNPGNEMMACVKCNEIRSPMVLCSTCYNLDFDRIEIPYDNAVDVSEASVGDIVIYRGHGFLLCEFIAADEFYVHPVSIGTESRYQYMSGMSRWREENPDSRIDENNFLLLKNYDCGLIKANYKI